MPIFLIGFMASGKSSIGRKLSKIMETSFIDLDSEIEKEIGMSISDIFLKKGENFFRKIETDLLKKIDFKDEDIVASGGGTPCFFDNHYFMKSIGCTIYLKVGIDELLKRIKLDNDRPLLNNNKLNLRDYLTGELLKREPYYQMSNYIIDSDNISVNQVHELIQKIK